MRFWIIETNDPGPRGSLKKFKIKRLIITVEGAILTK